MEIIEKEKYLLFKERFNGHKITFRKWKDKDLIEIKADDNLAKANGYDTIVEMVEDILGYVCLPKWFRVDEMGNFYMVDRRKYN